MKSWRGLVKNRGQTRHFIKIQKSLSIIHKTHEKVDRDKQDLQGDQSNTHTSLLSNKNQAGILKKMNQCYRRGY